MYLERFFERVFALGTVLALLVLLAHYAPGITALTPFVLAAISWHQYRQGRPKVTRSR